MGKRVPEAAKIVGTTLKNLREAAGLSLKDISSVLGVSYQQVQKYERGQNRFPVEKLFELKSFYGVAYDDFFAGLSSDFGNAPDMPEHDLLTCFIKARRLRSAKLRKQIREVVMILVE